MPRVYLGLGSNLGDRLALLKDAVQRLRVLAGVTVIDASRLYESEPWESEPGQSLGEREWYLNCVVAIDTTLPARVLLEGLHTIEAALGRVRHGPTPEARRFEPRTVDIDILLYGDEVISVPDDLHVPHLLMAERAFVLRPLAELAPDLEHPVVYRRIAEILDELVDEHDVRPGDFPRRWFDD
jgi:2-amino-4-hydroxy-6-hydroxymethyldihydropteridine diphosphokinase